MSDSQRKTFSVPVKPRIEASHGRFSLDRLGGIRYAIYLNYSIVMAQPMMIGVSYFYFYGFFGGFLFRKSAHAPSS
jgi:hypothetical protein